MSARIGDDRSMWESGVLSHINAVALQIGVAPGAGLQEFAEVIRAR